ncbi:MAG: bifunctional aldolase/short-chain dehydrogenase [Rhodospirillales bacterium]|jgi:rhamnose utilization protein RhaD (predicted bifunctional aldolase and dehydrogenase)/NAD(P)-dependent dehydrogenase (short-subunit alcohol dehydrogenase family)
MKNQWSDKAANEAVKRYGALGVNADLALRVHTTRLLGQEPKLVLHGGGNTSVKTRLQAKDGEVVEVLCVKGSGWDMGDIEPAGLPAVRLAPLLKLAKLKSLSDEEMVNFQRINLLDASSPNPSVETLLHAFLPHKYIDHSHANAILSLTDLPDGADHAQAVFGQRLGLVPFIKPGFDLAKKAKQVFEANPKVQGLVLLKHGLFTFGDTARQAYERHIKFVSMAERYLAQARKKRVRVFMPARQPRSIAPLAEVAPILRGRVALNLGNGAYRRMVLDFRTGPEILAYVNGRDVARISSAGTVTPDHVIRIKGWPLIVPAPEAGKLQEFAAEVEKAVERYVAGYTAYFEKHNAKANPKKKMLDPMPRVILVPGLGLFGLGASKKDARVAADLAETTVAVVADATALGRFESIPKAKLFDMEYWSLEQAKLGKGAEKALARQVVAVTGGGSGIGAAVAQAFAKEGAEVAVLDLNLEAACLVAKGIKGLAVACDVTDPDSVKAAFLRIAETYGGVDIVVSNAGAAWQGKIGTVDESLLRKSFELNFWGHQRVSQAALHQFKAQGSGGCLLFNTSKQAVNPGKDFGPYGLPKAATLFLMKQYALDHGRDGVRANAVNADRIRSGLLTESMIASRAKARGVTVADYMAGNLLGREVEAKDVAQAFVDLANASKTTACVVTVDGGNIEASLR